jgi:hypothetical protein
MTAISVFELRDVWKTQAVTYFYSGGIAYAGFALLNT